LQFAARSLQLAILSPQLAARSSQLAIFKLLFIRGFSANPIPSIPAEPTKFVGYFYPDGIVKYDGFSTFQIDRTISKETLYSSSQRYNISQID
jgi:hypothetical protein